jgi:hypothetical protein
MIAARPGVEPGIRIQEILVISISLPRLPPCFALNHMANTPGPTPEDHVGASRDKRFCAGVGKIRFRSIATIAHW